VKAVTSKKWNGLCPAGKHGLDYEGQPCDRCPDDARAADARARARALAATKQAMEAADALADRLRGPLRRRLKLKKPITTFHRGLWGGFTVQADHCDPVPGLHVFVQARVTGEGTVGYHLEVSGPSDLTEREVIEVIALLTPYRLRARRRAHNGQP
jgi:hypothetical protein